MPEWVQGLSGPAGFCRTHQAQRVSSGAADTAPCSHLKYDFKVHFSVTRLEAEQTSHPCDRTVNRPTEGCGEETRSWDEALGNSSDIHSAEQNHKHFTIQHRYTSSVNNNSQNRSTFETSSRRLNIDCGLHFFKNSV